MPTFYPWRGARSCYATQRRAGFLLILFFCTRSLFAAEPKALSLAAALDAAADHSRTLVADGAAARAYRDDAIAAAQLPDPILQLGLDNLPTEGKGAFRLDDEPMTMQNIGVMQTYTRSGKREAWRNQFEREAEVEELRARADLAELREQTAQAWLQLFYKQQLLERLQAQRQEAARTVDVADAEFRGGRGQQTDVFAARLELTRLDDQLQALHAQISNARDALERWTGLPKIEGIASPPSIRDTHWTNHGVQHQLDLHPDIALMNAQERAALASADVARQETRADWSWSLMYGKRAADYADVVSVGVSVPIEWNRKNRQNRTLAAELSRVEQVRARRDEMVRAHQLAIEQLLTQWRAQLARLDHYDRTLLPLSKERERAALAGYRGNQLPLSAVFEARQGVIATEMERLRIEETAASLWATLEYRFPELTSSTAAPSDSQEPAL